MLQRITPFDSIWKRTCIAPCGYLVIGSAHSATIDSAQAGPSGNSCVLLNGTFEWIPIVLVFLNLFPVAVLMRCAGAPYSERVGFGRIAHCEFNGPIKLPPRLHALED